jgi:hypothetical protein
MRKKRLGAERREKLTLGPGLACEGVGCSREGNNNKQEDIPDMKPDNFLLVLIFYVLNANGQRAASP